LGMGVYWFAEYMGQRQGNRIQPKVAPEGLENNKPLTMEEQATILPLASQIN